MARLGPVEEQFVLLAMQQALVERALWLREHTPAGTLLIFPSYYRLERTELTGHPAVLVSYRFHGFLDDIYATLVVRLHHSRTIENDELWRYAADFKTLTGKQLGVKLTRLGEGAGELEVYFDPVELEAVVSLLAGPGMIERLDFGGFILLRPEVISRYAAAVVRKHPQEMGCIREDELLAGDLDYQDFKRLPPEDEAVVLRTLLETFISRA